MRIEGIDYEINFERFKVGYSFFVPCIDQASAKKHIKKALTRFGYELVLREVIEGGIKGIRVWRV